MCLRIFPIAKKGARIIAYIVLVLLLLCMGGFFLLGTDKVQHYLINSITDYIKKEYNADVSLKKIRLSLTNALILDELLLHDQSKDTLFYAKETDFYLSLFPSDTMSILRGIEVFEVQAHIKELEDGKWNYSFFIKGQDTTPTPTDYGFMHYIQKLTLYRPFFTLSSKQEKWKVDAYYLQLDMQTHMGHTPLFQVMSFSSDALNIVRKGAASIKNPSHISYPMLLQQQLRMLQNLPFRWQIEEAIFKQNTFVWEEGNIQHKIGGDITFLNCKKDNQHIAHTMQLHNIDIDGIKVTQLNLDMSLTHNEWWVKQLALQYQQMSAAVQLKLTYDNLYHKDSTLFARSLEGMGTVSVQDLPINALQEIVDSATFSWLPKGTHLHVPTTSFHITQTSVNMDSLVVMHQEHPILELGASVSTPPGVYERDKMFFNVQKFRLLLRPEEYPTLFAFIEKKTQITWWHTFPLFTVIGTYEGSFCKGEGAVKIGLGGGELESKVHFQHNQDTSFEVQASYESHWDSPLAIWKNMSFVSLKGAMQIYISQKGKVSVKSSSTHMNNFRIGEHLYETCSMEGFFIENLLNASLSINNSFSSVSINCSADLNEILAIPITAKIDLRQLDFQSIGWSQVPLQGSMHMDANLVLRRQDKTNPIDVFGRIQIGQIRLVNNYGRYFLDEMSLEARQKDTQNIFSLQSAELGSLVMETSLPMTKIGAYLKSHFIQLFPYWQEHKEEEDTTKSMPSPSLIIPTLYDAKMPTSFQEQDFFEVKLHLKNFAPFNFLLHQHLEHLDSLDVVLRVDPEPNQWRFEMRTPAFSWNKLKISRFSLHTQLSQHNLLLSGHIGQLMYPEIFSLSDVSIGQDSVENSLFINTASGNWELGLLMDWERNPTYIQAHLRMLRAKIDGRLWEMDTLTALYLSKDTFAFRHFLLRHFSSNVMHQEEQKVYMDMRLYGERQEVQAGVSQFSLAPILKLMHSSGFSMGGSVNGQLSYTRIKGKNPDIGLNFSVDSFQLNADSVGYLQGKLTYNKGFDIFEVDLNTDNPEYDFSIRKSYSSDKSRLLDIQLNKVRTHLLHYYTRAFFEDLGGYMKGNLALMQKGDSLFLEGEVALEDASIKVDYTQCTYDVAPSTVLFKGGNIIFPNIPIYDALRQQGNVDGYIHLPLSDLQHFSYDFRITSEQIMGLNTTDRHNDIFYGKVLAKVLVHTKGNGTQDTLLLTITPQSQTTLNINIGNTGMAKEELKFLTPLVASTLATPLKNTTLRRTNAQLYARKDKEDIQRGSSHFYTRIDIGQTTKSDNVNVHLLLDRSGSNMVHLQGVPELELSYDSQNALSMSGKFNVYKGRVTLVLLEDLHLQKEFDIDPNYNNYLVWNKDITNPSIHLQMLYLVERVPLNNLLASLTTANIGVSPTPTSTNVSTSTTATNTQTTASAPPSNASVVSVTLSDMYVMIIASGTAQKMDLNFDIHPATNSTNLLTGGVSVELNKYLQTLRQDQEMMRLQASSLLLLNTFSLNRQALSGGGAIANVSLVNYTNQLLSSTVGNLFLSPINNSINNLIKSKIVTLGFDYNAYNTYQLGNVEGASSLTVRDIRNQIGFNVRLKLSERLNLRISPGIDFNLYNNNSTSGSSVNRGGDVNFLPNAQLSYDITKNGLLTFNAFNTANYDNLIQAQRNRTGISLLLSKDFDIKKTNKKKKPQIPPKHKNARRDTTRPQKNHQP